MRETYGFLKLVRGGKEDNNTVLAPPWAKVPFLH